MLCSQPSTVWNRGVGRWQPASQSRHVGVTGIGVSYVERITCHGNDAAAAIGRRSSVVEDGVSGAPPLGRGDQHNGGGMGCGKLVAKCVVRPNTATTNDGVLQRRGGWL